MKVILTPMMHDVVIMSSNSNDPIDEFITSNPESKLNSTHTIVLQGQNVDLPVYRLPLKLLFFNIRNGRFAAEYIELKKKENREFDTTNKDDAKIIQNLLIEIDSKQSNLLLNDLKKYGQREPGIITHDGHVINGNRRMAALQTLVDQGEDRFSFIHVARLPPNVSTEDLWKVEAGIQLSRRVQLDYGPINTLLKFKEGIESGLSPAQIAKSLYGGFSEDEILENLEQLKLITKYTGFIGEAGNFKKAEGVNEHFIDLRKILKKAEREGYSPVDLMKIQRIGFQLIHDGVPQRDLRKIKDILRHESVSQNFFKAYDYSQPESPGKKIEKLFEAKSKDQFTPARTLFNDSLDSVKAADDSEEPIKLLKRAVINLESIDPENNSLKESDSKKLIRKIKFILEEIEKHQD
jgi:hypothetical protein